MLIKPFSIRGTSQVLNPSTTLACAILVPACPLGPCTHVHLSWQCHSRLQCVRGPSGLRAEAMCACGTNPACLAHAERQAVSKLSIRKILLSQWSNLNAHDVLALDSMCSPPLPDAPPQEELLPMAQTSFISQTSNSHPQLHVPPEPNQIPPELHVQTSNDHPQLHVCPLLVTRPGGAAEKGGERDKREAAAPPLS